MFQQGPHLLLTHEEPSKIAADDTLIPFTFYLAKKIRFDVSCVSFAKQRIHVKYRVIFSLKTKMKTYSKLSSAAVVLGALRVKYL